MKLENQIWAAYLLLLHCLFIALGMGATLMATSLYSEVAYDFKIDLRNLLDEPHSDQELQSWLRFLELPHEEMLISEESVVALLDSNSTLDELAFFKGIATADRVEFLSSRLSATKGADNNRCIVKLKNASREDASQLLLGLSSVYENRLLKIGRSYDGKIEPRCYCHSLKEPKSTVLAGASSGLVALLASSLLLVVWTICRPVHQRKLPISVSLDQLIEVSFAIALTGAIIGLAFDSLTNIEWESETTVQLKRQTVTPVFSMSEKTHELVNTLASKIKTQDPFSDDLMKVLITTSILENGLENWEAFRVLQEEIKPEDFAEEVSTDDQLCDFISSRLSIEPTPDAVDTYTIRFRCGNAEDSKWMLSTIVRNYRDHLKKTNKQTSARIAKGVQLPNLTSQLIDVSLPQNPTKVHGHFNPRIGFQGAFFCATLSLVLLSSLRVLAGAPPI